MQQKQQEINNNTQAVQEAQEKLAQAQQKHSQSAEANAAAHTAVEKAEKEAQEARQAVKTQQQAVDQAQNELNLVQASQEENKKLRLCICKGKSTWRKHKCHGGICSHTPDAGRSGTCTGEGREKFESRE